MDSDFWIDAIGIKDLPSWNPEDNWKQEPSTSLAVPIGTWRDPSDPNYVYSRKGKSSVFLDLVKDGPHGIVLGSTGTGKSYLTKSVLFGTAATYSPRDVQFLVLQIFGSEMAHSVSKLPHTAATFGCVEHRTDILVDIDAALTKEMSRRHALIQASGANSFDEHNSACYGEDRLPRIVVVVEEAEFALSASKHKDVLAKILTDVCRDGTALGFHLLITGWTYNSLPEQVVRAINKGYGITLRTSDRDTSVQAVGVPDAVCLSGGTGHALLRRHGNLESFAGYSPTNHELCEKLEANTDPVAKSLTKGLRDSLRHVPGSPFSPHFDSVS